MKRLLQQAKKGWFMILVLMFLIQGALLAFNAEDNKRSTICPDNDNTTLTELNGRFQFCEGEVATYVATFTGATDPSITFFWDENGDGNPDPGEELPNPVIINGDEFRIELEMTLALQGGRIIAVYMDIDCMDDHIIAASTFPLIVSCGISIEDPCTCENNAFLPGSGQFSETIVVSGLPGDTWTVIAVEGLYQPSANVTPLPGQEILPGTILTVDMGDNTRYLLEAKHIDGQGYSITVSNGIDELTISNQCFYPNPQINLLPDYCVNYPPFALEVTDANHSGTFLVFLNGMPVTHFDPAALGQGNYLFTYVFIGEESGQGYPGCTQTNYAFVSVYNNYENSLSCVALLHASFDENGQIEVTPAMILSDDFGCMSTFDVNIIGKPDNILTCDDVNQFFNVVISDPIRGGSCMGVLKAEDKTPPVFVCEDVTVSCTNNLFTIPVDDFISVSDNCGDVTLTLMNLGPLVNPTCNPDFSASITRIIRATDAIGNESFCTQTIFLDRPELSDIDFPADITVEGCSFTSDISPEITGYPTIDGERVGFFCEFFVLYNDIPFTLCQGSRLVRRMWTVMDHCGGGNRVEEQLILIRDVSPPDVICPPDITLTTEAGVCTVQYTIPTPVVSDNCVPEASINIIVLVNGIPRNPGQTVTLDAGINTLVYRVNDPCLNFNECTQTIEVLDEETPQLFCNNATVALNSAGTVTIDPNTLGTIIAVDNCGVIELLISKVNSPTNFMPTITYDCSEVGVNLAAVQARDAAGNTNTCFFFITVQDNLGPQVTFCPADLTLECGIDPLPDFEDAEFSENCPTELTVEFEENAVATCCNAEVITRTWTATDQGGNTAQCVQVITFEDNTAPDLVCQTSVTLPLNEAGQVQMTEDDLIISVSDACCNEVQILFDPVELDCSDTTSSTIVLITVTDECSNSATCEVEVFVVDDLPPTFVNCQDTINFYISDHFECPISYYNGLVITPDAFDNCDGSVSVSRSFTNVQSVCNGPDPGIGERIYSFVATDLAGNVNTCTTVVRLFDDVPPAVTCEQNVEVYLDADGNGSISSSDLLINLEDFCDASPVLVSETFNFTCDDLGPVTVTIRAIDCAGNEGTCESVLVIIDDIPPLAVCPPNITVECSDNNSNPTDPLFTGMATATDNCTIEDIEITSESISGTECSYILFRSFVVTDQSNNSGTCVQSITVEDNLPPVSICTDPIDFVTTAECTGSDFDIDLEYIVEINRTLIADCYTDACSNEVVVEDNFDINQVVMDCEEFGGTITVTYTVRDSCGNIAATIPVDLQIVDLTGPVFTLVPADTILQCGEMIPVPNLSTDVAAEDACSMVTEISFDDFSMMTPWIVTAQPGNATVDLSGAPQAITITGSDTQVFQNLIAVASSAAKAGTLSFDWSYVTTDEPAYDQFGISIGGITTIIVDDFPQIQSGSESFAVSPGAEIRFFVETIDNFYGAATVEITNIQFTLDEMECPVVNCLIRRYVAEDACGNVGVAYQLITIVDTVAPVFTCIDTTLHLNEDGEAILFPELLVEDISDDCSEDFTISASQMLFTCADIGISSNFVSISVTDECDNTGTCTIVVTVLDTIPPVLMCPDTVEFFLSDYPGMCNGFQALLDNPPGSDNCEIISITREGNNLESYCGGSLTGIRLREVTFTATDASSNIGTCSLIMKIVDDVPPLLTCVANHTIELDNNGTGSVAAADLLISIEDDCTANPSLNNQVFYYTCEDLGINMVVITGADCAGNVGSCMVDISVIDNVSPELTCVSELTLSLDEDGVAILSETEVIVNLTDNCSSDLEIELSQSVFTCADLAGSPVSVTLTVEDESDNSNSCSFEVFIEDAISPVFENCTTHIVLLSELMDCDFDLFGDPEYFGLEATDQCDGALTIPNGNVIISQDFCDNETSPELVGGTVTFSVQDASANSANCTINWTVENDLPPVLTCPATYDIELDIMTSTATLNVAAVASAEFPIVSCGFSADLSVSGQTEYSCQDVGESIFVEITAEICTGNQSTCTVQINVIDPDPLVISCPADTLVYCGIDLIDLITEYEDTRFIASGLCLESTGLLTFENIDDCGVGSVSFEFTAGTAYGADSTCTTIITVALDPTQEITESDIIWPEDYLSLCRSLDSSDTGAPVLLFLPDCADVFISFTDEVVEADQDGCEVIERTWTVEENCYDVEFTQVQIITRPLEGIPLQTAPVNAIVVNEPGMCGATVHLTLVAGPACDTTVVVENSFNSGGADASGFYPVGITTVTYTLTNSCEEVNTYQITVEVADIEAPMVSCSPNSLTMLCHEDPMEVVNGFSISYSDNCSDLMIDTLFNPNLNECGIGTIQVIFRAADNYDNVGSCSRIINVIEDVDFELMLSDFIWPTDAQVGCNADILPISLGEPVLATDLPCAEIVFTYEDILETNSPETGCNTITRTWMATDLCTGSEVTYDQTIVQAGETPVIVSGPADVTVDAEPDTCGANVSLSTLVFYTCSEDDFSVINDYNGTSDASDFYPVGTTNVLFTVNNSCGNSATLELSVTVEDNTNPEVTCPSDVSITCLDDLDDFVTELVFEANDACGISETEISYDTPVLDCGTGSTVVTFTATDQNTNTSACTLTITVEPVYLSESDISWPADFELSCGQNREDTTITGTPVFNNFCGTPVVSFEDGEETEVDGCISFVRNWSIEDTCTDSLFSYEQVIFIPVYTNLEELIATNQIFDVSNDPGECGAALTVLFPIDDFCAPDVTILNSFTENGADASGFYPVGTTVVTYTVSNACGVLFTDNATITVSDAENPTLSCGIQGMIVVTCADDLEEVILNDFVLQLDDNCGIIDTTILYNFNVNDCGVGTVQFTFMVTDQNMNTNACTRTITISPDTEVFDESDVIWPESPLIVEGCDTDESPVSLESEPELTAPYLCLNPEITFEDEEIDPTDDPEYCRQIIRTWTITSVCTGETLAQFAQTIYFEPATTPIIVNGIIARESGAGVLDVQVNSNSLSRASSMSDETGYYLLRTEVAGNGIEITPEKEDTEHPRLTTADILAIMRHIRGERLLDSPYKIIAADVDRDGRVTAMDILHIRELILGRKNSLPNGHWRFVDAAYEFENPASPLREDFPEFVRIPYSDVPVLSIADFVAVQLGDAANTFQAVNNRSNPAHAFTLHDKAFSGGQSIQITLRPEELSQVAGYQFAFRFDRNKLQLQNIEWSEGMSDKNLNLQKVAQGLIKISWDALSGIGLTGFVPELTLEFKTIENSSVREVVSIAYEEMTAELYRSNSDLVYRPELNFIKELPQTPVFELYQNHPNPTDGYTIIPFHLPEAGDVSLSIYDMNGKLIHMIRNNFSAGENQFILERELSRQPDGIYYYRIDTDQGSATKKLILNSNVKE